MQIARKRRRSRKVKAWSQMTVQEQMKEATEAKARLQAQLDALRRTSYIGPDLWPSMRNTSEAIGRWDATINKLTDEIARGANK